MGKTGCRLRVGKNGYRHRDSKKTNCIFRKGWGKAVRMKEDNISYRSRES